MKTLVDDGVKYKKCSKCHELKVVSDDPARSEFAKSGNYRNDG